MFLISCNHWQYLDVDGFILRTVALSIEVMKLHTTRETSLSLRIFPIIQHLSPVMLQKYNGLFPFLLHREMGCHNTNSNLTFAGQDHAMFC